MVWRPGMPEPTGKEFYRKRAALLKAWRQKVWSQPAQSPPTYNPLGRSNKFTELLGEHFGLNQIDLNEYEFLLHPEDKGTPHGFDTVLLEKKSGKIIILEYKGMSARESDAQKATRNWIKEVNAKTISPVEHYAGSTEREIEVSRRVAKALTVGEVEYQVHHSKVSRKGKVTTEIKKSIKLPPGTFDEYPFEQAEGGPVRVSQSFEKLSPSAPKNLIYLVKMLRNCAICKAKALSSNLTPQRRLKSKYSRIFRKPQRFSGRRWSSSTAWLLTRRRRTSGMGARKTMRRKRCRNSLGARPERSSWGRRSV